MGILITLGELLLLWYQYIFRGEESIIDIYEFGLMKLVSLYENEKCYLDILFYYVVQWSKNDIIAACDTNVLLLQGITSSPFK